MFSTDEENVQRTARPSFHAVRFFSDMVMVLHINNYSRAFSHYAVFTVSHSSVAHSAVVFQQWLISACLSKNPVPNMTLL